MSSINVRPELYVSSESANKACTSGINQKIRPVTSNIVAGLLSGDVTFIIETGHNQYLDLMKSHIVVNYTYTITTDAGRLEQLAQCIFDRGQLYLNGSAIATSNNWTQDSEISKRLNFSETYNKNQHEMRYLGVTAATANYPGANGTSHSSIEYLDALMMRTGHCIVPPGCRLRLVLTPAAANGAYKAIIGDGADTAGVAVAVNDLFMNCTFLQNEDLISQEHILKFVTLDSFKTPVVAANHVQQYSVSNNLVRIAAAFQDTTADSSTLTKFFNAPMFRYTTDGASATTTDKLNTLQLKAGNQSLPASPFDNTTYGLRESHAAFVNESEGVLDPAAKESFISWAAAGELYTMPVIKSVADSVKNIELKATFASAPTAYAFLVAFYEQFVSIQYGQNGQMLSTVKMV